MTKRNGEVVGFTFQEIPLEEALNVVLAGEGNYSEVKQMLLEKLPTLAPDKAFAFGLPGGKEVPEEQRRGLCMSINATLKRADIRWRITYSGSRKMFICVPRKPKVAHELKKYTGDRSQDQRILELRGEGFTVPEIAKQVSAPLGRIQYLCYSVAAKVVRAKKEDLQHPTNGHSAESSAAVTPTALVEAARQLFKYQGDFKDRQGKAIRKAISIIGINSLKLSPKDLGPLLGLTSDGAYYNAHHATSDFGKEEIKALQKAMN